MRKLLAVMIGAALLSAGGMATKAEAVPCNTLTTIGQLATLGECQTGDKNLDYVSNVNFPLATTFTFNAVNPDLYILDFTFPTGTTATIFNLTYIIGVLDPNQVITSVSLDSNVQPLPPTVTGGTLVNKVIASCTTSNCIPPVFFDNLTSLNGSTDVSNPGLSSRFVGVNETWMVSGTQTLLDSSNAFTQTGTKIPEPASMLLLGLGLVGLGFWGRTRARE